MPDVEKEQFCAQQVNIPPTFPFVLKQYAKAAIKTQPYDLVRWSAAYFRALAQGKTPPAKDRLEFPPLETPSGLTPGYLHVLIKQLGKEGTVTVEDLREKWLAICLKEEGLYEMLQIGQFGATLDWLCFIGVAAGFLTNSLEETMVLVCELLTDEAGGGAASVPLSVFSKVYSYLASLDCGSLDNRHVAGRPVKTSASDDKKEMWNTSASTSTPANSCESTEQLYMAVSSPSNSPQVSRVPSELDTSLPTDSRARKSVSSTSTLTPENLEDDEENVLLHTFYDNRNTLRDSPHSSEEVIALDGGNKINVEEPVNFNNEDAGDECQLQTNSSAPEMHRNGGSHETSRAKTTGANRSQPALKQVSSLDEIKVESMSTGDALRVHRTKASPSSIPGIGAIVEPAHVATVLSYLRERAVEQGGMINPSNFCHFMCPPLEGHVVSLSPDS